VNTDLAADLTRVVRGETRFDDLTRALYSTDASAYQIKPLGVVCPLDQEDVQALLETAVRHRVPVLARGGGSSLAGQAIGEAVIVDFARHMRRVLEINAEERWVRVEPGVVCDTLNATLKPHQLMLGPDPASSNRATIAGMIGNNATGAHSICYGMLADHLLAADVFLEDASALHFAALEPAALETKLRATTREGELYRKLTALTTHHATLIRERFPRTWRRASGYSLNYLLPSPQTKTRPPNWYSADPYPPLNQFNLAPVLAGSEGTLAVITEARLRCVPRPKATGLGVIAFDSIAAAADATPTILESQPTAVELIDALLIELTRSVPAYARQLTFIEGQPAAILVLEFVGENETHVVAQLDALERRLQTSGIAPSIIRALTPSQQSNVWGVRKVGLGLLMSMRSEAKPTAFIEDVAVPVERLGEYVRAVERVLADYGVSAGYYAHASAGCLHIRPMLNLKRAEDVAKLRPIAAAVLEIVISMGGALSGEHGDGLARSMWNGQLFGPELYAAFREVKQLFDPHHRLNPGKVVDAPDAATHLRYGENYRTFEFKTHLSFAKEGGFARAVEQCNGAAVCRKTEGVMCPSYIATRDEEHSTRGRANALRAALSGHLPSTALTSERMHAVLDLCLECKACQAECPSGVDMAKIKYEFLAHYQARHGVPIRSSLFAHLHTLAHVGSKLAPLVNLITTLPLTRWVNEKILHLAPQRALPLLASRSFRELYTTPPSSSPNVILFVDTFTNYFYPSLGLSAVKVLSAAGYTPRLVAHGCCGRPMISKGLLVEAKRTARENVTALVAYAEQGLPIIGLEPSCILTLRDEYLDLLPDDPQVQSVAKHAMLLEEFLAPLIEQGALPIHWDATPRHILVHRHCHQKASGHAHALMTLLRSPGWQVTEIDAGCCGMAGSFGYEAEHYTLSQAIGEDRLFPTVRATSADTVLVAPGVSCRQQIEHGTGRVARHPVEVLAEALDPIR